LVSKLLGLPFAGKYISLEMIIEKTRETYYKALQDSSAGCHEGEKTAYVKK